jgi:hypothetical protein
MERVGSQHSKTDGQTRFLMRDSRFGCCVPQFFIASISSKFGSQALSKVRQKFSDLFEVSDLMGAKIDIRIFVQSKNTHVSKRAVGTKQPRTQLAIQRAMSNDELDSSMPRKEEAEMENQESEEAAATALTSLGASAPTKPDDDDEDGKAFSIPQRFTKSGRKRAVPFALKVSEIPLAPNAIEAISRPGRCYPTAIDSLVCCSY